jgi:hypothetical protein
MSLLDKVRRVREAAAAEAAQRAAQTAPPAMHSYDRNDIDDKRPARLATPPAEVPRPCGDSPAMVSLPFGAYPAVPLPEVPTDYLEWAWRGPLERRPALRDAVLEELHRRGYRPDLYDCGWDPFPDDEGQP